MRREICRNVIEVRRREVLEGRAALRQGHGPKAFVFVREAILGLGVAASAAGDKTTSTDVERLLKYQGEHPVFWMGCENLFHRLLA